ncbi:phosphoribosyltransferase family protein [Clostridium sp. BL-8]|uniref:ComF family protein n=1 Tax=Clostridium sp. BL-8 TaxID=349938 RepID=UPI00098CB0AB|nr:phosphoribosyltransferase family protein [Clostridium sp. BL-8]OOM75560.1 DNA utilization protein GntX [Clostridium sp. BL-8]
MGKAFNRIIRNIWEGIIEVVYPRENYCIICKEEDCFGICEHCKKSIKTIDILYQDKIISYGYYGGVLKELILKFKYKHNFTAGDILAELLEDYIIKNFNYKEYIITYIPLSKKSRKVRGFNQCEYIARKIARDLCIEVLEVLIKSRETKEQKTLKKDERYENIKDAFKLKAGLRLDDCNIILIDDVTTTGATINEACRLLKKIKIKDIKLLTLAKSHI